MNHFLKYSFSIFCLLACSACDDDGIGVLDIEIPEGYAPFARPCRTRRVPPG